MADFQKPIQMTVLSVHLMPCLAPFDTTCFRQVTICNADPGDSRLLQGREGFFEIQPLAFTGPPAALFKEFIVKRSVSLATLLEVLRSTDRSHHLSF
ncbi:hypothetical protein [Rhizobium leguminosarum]|uniref:hypothetical protein n=1 Tax=Rhizobium leguminosarum TaxID=384 RepID=UPI001AE9B775|nr:hypothetical protein [Rhizobium leguminosarum]MBP2444105.1 hypothetical protein [Rhizobium leguminosarum]